MAAKRLFDLLISCAGLVLLLPLLLAISLAILIDSGSPVIFRQVRVGRNGTNFEILKFRTMIADSDVRGRLTVKNDARITRFGRFLRRYKLDELPQLFNVMIGDMSLVGPRPEVPEFVEHYSAHDKKLILSVRPGITDNASIEFRNESDILDGAADPHACYVEKILPVKLSLYRDYVTNRSLGADILIFLKTMRAIW